MEFLGLDVVCEEGQLSACHVALNASEIFF
jgi:hypothetical protein